ncbi:MAG: dihydroorotate dehydrogenase [Candidatus Thermoplasmatota archaeon]
MNKLITKIGNLQFENPTILASGIMGEDAGSMNRIIASGAGGIVTKSIGIIPRTGYPNPTFVELEHGLLNAMGLPNPGIDAFSEELQQLTKTKTPIIGSIYGANSEEFINLAQKMESYKVDAIELNVSCPHAKRFGLEVGSDPVLLQEITNAVKQSVHIPVFVKLSPNVTSIADIASAAEKGGADAIVAINTVKAMKINIELQRPILANKIGGYSGKAIKPIGVRCVYEIAERVQIPIIGAGGITDGKDVIEYIMAGATAVQIGSAVYYRDIDVFKKICNECTTWLHEHNVKKLSELVGVAHT